MSGPPTGTRALVYARADNCCELCGVYAYGGSVHHRRPRGMGGDRRPETNAASNLLLVCGHATSPDGCHQWIENNRTHALELGLLVPKSQYPAEIPVRLLVGLVLLDDVGNYIYQEEAA